MMNSILSSSLKYEELPCRPPFLMVHFQEQLFTQNVIHVLTEEILALPGTVDQLARAEKERDERLPIFPHITIVALGSSCTRDGRVFVPVWKPRLHTPIEWVRDYGAVWPAGTRFILA